MSQVSGNPPLSPPHTHTHSSATCIAAKKQQQQLFREDHQQTPRVQEVDASTGDKTWFLCFWSFDLNKCPCEQQQLPVFISNEASFSCIHMYHRLCSLMDSCDFLFI